MSAMSTTSKKKKAKERSEKQFSGVDESEIDEMGAHSAAAGASEEDGGLETPQRRQSPPQDKVDLLMNALSKISARIDSIQKMAKSKAKHKENSSDSDSSVTEEESSDDGNESDSSMERISTFTKSTLSTSLWSSPRRQLASRHPEVLIPIAVSSASSLFRPIYGRDNTGPFEADWVRHAYESIYSLGHHLEVRGSALANYMAMREADMDVAAVFFASILSPALDTIANTRFIMDRATSAKPEMAAEGRIAMAHVVPEEATDGSPLARLTARLRKEAARRAMKSIQRKALERQAEQLVRISVATPAGGKPQQQQQQHSSTRPPQHQRTPRLEQASRSTKARSSRKAVPARGQRRARPRPAKMSDARAAAHPQPLYERPRARVAEWAAIGAAPRVVRVLQDGLRLRFWRDPPPYDGGRYLSTQRHRLGGGRNREERAARQLARSAGEAPTLRAVFTPASDEDPYAGVGIVFAQHWRSRFVSYTTLVRGRCAAAIFDVGGKHIAVVCLYAPASADDRSQFWDTFEVEFGRLHYDDLLLMGVFNLLSVPSIPLLHSANAHLTALQRRDLLVTWPRLYLPLLHGQELQRELTMVIGTQHVLQLRAIRRWQRDNIRTKLTAIHAPSPARSYNMCTFLHEHAARSITFV